MARFQEGNMASNEHLSRQLLIFKGQMQNIHVIQVLATLTRCLEVNEWHEPEGACSCTGGTQPSLLITFPLRAWQMK
eukprot:242327-Amphidinium_carterae.1